MGMIAAVIGTERTGISKDSCACFQDPQIPSRNLGDTKPLMVPGGTMANAVNTWWHFLSGKQPSLPQPAAQGPVAYSDSVIEISTPASKMR